MNYFKKLSKGLKGKDRVKNLVISIVILIEVIAILMVASFAWVETVSSIKITNKNDEAIVDSYVFTHAMIGNKAGTIDLSKYFKQAGDMHLSPASSADGRTMFFPKKATATTYGSTYRKGTVSDKNTAYFSVTFKLKTDDSADFFFTDVPTFSNLGSDIRVSVTAYSEGADPNTHLDSNGNEVSNTKIYALTESSAAVVNTTAGGTKATTVETFDQHRKKSGQSSSNRLFEVAAEETKIVTINLWLQGSSMNSNISSPIVISDFGITSDLTPRHVTLLPTPEWDISGVTNQTFYAWCWDAPTVNGVKPEARLYKLTLDEEEHYSFDYNGTYRKTLFFRCGNPNLTSSDMSGDWKNLGLWNKTADTTIPKDPVDPTYIIETISGGAYDGDISGNQSTGTWVDPVKISLAYTTSPADQDAMGSIAATTYIGTTTSTHVMEQTNSTNADALHHATLHGWSGKRLKLSATPKTVNGNAVYALEGWYSDAEGTNRLSSNEFNISATAGTEVTYYAKFKELRKITLKQYIDGSSSSNAATLALTSTGATATGTNTSKSIIVDKDATVTLKETLTNSGYSFSGFFNVQSGGSALTGVTTSGTTKSVNITANSANYETTYYARFTANTHAVNLYTIGSTGSTVQYGNETAATSVEKTDVKYNTSVTIKANPAAGYKFVGWYTNSNGTGTAASTSASYTFTMGDDDVTYYAKFETLNIYLTGYLNGSDVTTTSTDRKFTFNSTTGEYTLSYKFTGNSEQFVTIYDGSKAYHPASANAGSGTAGTVYNSYIAGDDSTNPAPYYKWRVPACKGTTVSFTWNPGTKVLSWSITYRELYLKPNSNWTQDSARFAAYVYGDDNAWYSMTSAGNDYYKVTVPASYPNVIFCRMDGSKTTNNWDNKWNQTGDLTIPADKNCFTVPDGAWNGSTATWSLY